MHVALWFRANWDRVLGWGAVAIGGLLLVVGTVRIMHARYLADQLSFLMSSGIGGLACVAFGAGLLVIASQQEEWSKLDQLEQTLRETGRGDAANFRLVNGGRPEQPAREPARSTRKTTA